MALARKHAGDGGGTRLLVEALLLHRHLAHVDVVAVEARKAAHARGVTATLPARRPSASSYPPCRLAATGW